MSYIDNAQTRTWTASSATDARFGATEAGPLTRAWIAALVPETDADAPDAVEGGEMTLTAEDLKQIKNGTISSITRSPDVAAFLAAGFRAVLADAGVLTEGNIHASAGLYARFEETTYEQVWKVLEEAGLA